MSVIHWKLTAGGMDGQESSDEKRQKGYDYVELLAKDEKIINVVDDGKKFIIYTE